MFKIKREAFVDKRAPMPSAPFKFDAEGRVAWGKMWESYCVLAQEGGPPHRETLLTPSPVVNQAHENYLLAQNEIIRGIRLVSELTAVPDMPGWIRVICDSPQMAAWLGEAINQENVAARANHSFLYLPVNEHYTLQGEIKNVITAVAKTTHYWQEHLAAEVKHALWFQATVESLWSRLFPPKVSQI